MSAHEFILQYGVIERNDFRNLRIAQQRLVKRARDLGVHNDEMNKARRHAAYSGNTPHMMCSVRSDSGVVCCKTSWHASRYYGRHDPHATRMVNHPLKHDIAVAIQHAQAVTTLKQTVRL